MELNILALTAVTLWEKAVFESNAIFSNYFSYSYCPGKCMRLIITWFWPTTNKAANLNGL